MKYSIVTLANIGRVAALATCAVACGPEMPFGPEGDEIVSPITYGTIDTDHRAVVALHTSATDPYATCSGTIVKVSPPWAWVATAAHCVSSPPSMVTIGHMDAPEVTFPVIDVMVNPSYMGNWYFDYALLRVLGASSTTPFVPLATPAEDTLAVGDTLTLVGYGNTENGPTTKRRTIQRAVQSLDALTLTHNNDNGGTCHGDSGGPGLADLTVGKRVVGIHSVGANSQCTNWGGKVRASAGYTSFLQPLLDKPTFDSCHDCFFSGGWFGPACKPLVNACFQPGTACNSYSSCQAGCTTQACIDACGITFPAGQTDYDALFACSCTACSPLCDEEALCGAPQIGCGFVSNDSACQNCVDGCCTEARACVDDVNGCADCFPDCNNNIAADALWQCLDNSACIGTCGLDVIGDFDGGIALRRRRRRGNISTTARALARGFLI